MILDSSSERYARLVEQHGLSSVHHEILRQVGSGKRVLELGCSTGFIGRLMAAQGCRVDGVELDDEAASIARPYYGHIHVGSLDDESLLGRIAGPYDAVICTEVLEHLSRPEGVLRACRRWLKDGGFALISVPNVAHWTTRWRLLTGRWTYQESGILDHTHLRFYTYWSAKDFVVAAGYRDEDAAHYPDKTILADKPILVPVDDACPRLTPSAIQRVMGN